MKFVHSWVRFVQRIAISLWCGEVRFVQIKAKKGRFAAFKGQIPDEPPIGLSLFCGQGRRFLGPVFALDRLPKAPRVL